jgi:hypothetical protein
MNALAIVGYAKRGSTKFEPAVRRLVRLVPEDREVGKIACFRERITPSGRLRAIEVISVIVA